MCRIFSKAANHITSEQMPKRQCLKDSKDIFWCYNGVSMVLQLSWQQNFTVIRKNLNSTAMVSVEWRHKFRGLLFSTFNLCDPKSLSLRLLLIFPRFHNHISFLYKICNTQYFQFMGTYTTYLFWHVIQHVITWFGGLDFLCKFAMLLWMMESHCSRS